MQRKLILRKYWIFSIYQFGESQAESYFRELIQVIKVLAAQPNLGRDRPELLNALKSFTHKSHNIYYSINTAGIFIERVLHQSRDLKNQF